jgi:hypothetical protein
VRHGKIAVLERLGLIFQEFDTKRLEISHIALNPNGAAVEVQMRCQHRERGADST